MLRAAGRARRRTNWLALAETCGLLYVAPQPVRRFSTKGAWESVPLIDIVQHAKGAEVNIPNDACFSLMDPKLITREVAEVREIFSAVGEVGEGQFGLQNLVVFTPNRMLLHEAMVQVATQVKIVDDIHYTNVVSGIYDLSMVRLGEEKQYFSDLRDFCEAAAKTEIKKFESGASDGLSLYEEIDAIFRVIVARSKKKGYQPGKFIPEVSIHKIMWMVLTDHLLKKAFSTKINDIVTPVITSQLSQGRLKTLPNLLSQDRENILIGLESEENRDRINFMVAGGPASGKGILTKKIEGILQDRGASLSQYAVIAPDRFKPILTRDATLGLDKAYHGTLLQEECRLIANRCRDAIMELMKSGRAPSTFVEMLVPYEDKVALGTYGGGQFRIYVASAKASKAVEGSWQRYQETGRYVPKEYVLAGQQRVSAFMPELHRTYQGSGRDIRVELHDTTGGFRDINAMTQNPMAILLPSEGLVYVFDLKKIFDFIKKVDIDPKSESPEKLYKQDRTIDDLANTFKQTYGVGNVMFVPPALTYSTMDELGAAAYAVYSHAEEQLFVLDREAFDNMKGQKEYEALFCTLDPTLSVQKDRKTDKNDDIIDARTPRCR